MLLILLFSICFCAGTFAQAGDNFYTQKLKQEIYKPKPNADSVKAFLVQGAHVGTRQMYGKTLLHFAAQKADYNLVKQLLDSGLDVNDANNKQHETPLHCITSSQYHANTNEQARLEIVKLLLQHGARVDVNDLQLNTALQNESTSGNAAILALLVNAGAKVIYTDQDNSRFYNNYRNNLYETIIPLVAAAKSGKIDAVKFLFKSDTLYYHYMLALNAAAENGHNEVVKFLLQSRPLIFQNLAAKNQIQNSFAQLGRGAVSADNASGNFALAMAAKGGHYETASLLLQYGISVNTSEDMYNINTSPLEYAVISGNYELVKLLLEHGASMQQKDPYKQGRKNALCLAAENNQLKIAELLIRSGADVNFHINYNVYSSPIMFAAEKGHLEMVKLLLKNGANVNSIQPYYNPIFLAIGNNHKAVVQLLLDSIDIKAKPTFLTGQLPTLISSNHLDMFTYLLEMGVSPDYENDGSQTPLMYAAMYNKLPFAKLLLQKGAQVNRIDYNGRTALDYAFSPEMESLLKSYGAQNRKKFKYKKSYTEVYRSRDSAEIDRKMAREISKNANAYDINLDSVKSYIRQGANVHISGFAKIGLMTLAVARLDTQLVQMLLQHGVDVNENNAYDIPLTVAAGFPRLFNSTPPKADSFHEERVKMAKLLIKNGANVNLRPKYGLSPLQAAVLSGNLELVQLLLQNGANLHGKYNRSLLVSAVSSGNIAVLEYLLQQKIKRNKYNKYAVAEAGRSGRTDMLRLLFSHGFKADDVSSYRYSVRITALNYAVELNDLDMLKLLLENGASVNPNPKDYVESSPMYKAATNGYDDAMDLLIKYGYKISGSLDKKDVPLMHFAVQKCDTTLVKTLLKHGADINIHGVENFTPYLQAKLNGAYCPVYGFKLDEWLLKMGADSTIHYKPETEKGFSIGSRHSGLGFGNFGRYNGIKFSVNEKDSLVNGVNFNFRGSKGKYQFRYNVNGVHTGFLTEAENVNGICINILTADIYDANGVAINGLLAEIGGFKGVSFSGLGLYSDDFQGFSFSGIAQGFENFYGVAVSPINYASYSSGYLLGGFNFASAHSGGIIGLVNAFDGEGTYGHGGKGMMIGIVNIVSGYNGLQIGILNLPYTKRNYANGGSKALQIGIINSGRIKKGVQIGLLNINKEKKHFKVLPLLNCYFPKEKKTN